MNARIRWALPLTALILCACRSAPRPPARGPLGVLCVRITPPSALVYVDDVAVRLDAAARATLRLPAGTHRIEVRAPGHFTAYREVSVPARAQTQVHVALRPDPEAAQ